MKESSSRNTSCNNIPYDPRKWFPLRDASFPINTYIISIKQSTGPRNKCRIPQDTSSKQLLRITISKETKYDEVGLPHDVSMKCGMIITLNDLDWCQRSLCYLQTKTRNPRNSTIYIVVHWKTLCKLMAEVMTNYSCQYMFRSML